MLCIDFDTPLEKARVSSYPLEQMKTGLDSDYQMFGEMIDGDDNRSKLHLNPATLLS